MGPQILMGPTSKAFIVVSFAFEKLLEMGLAVKFSMQGGIGAQAQFGTAVFTAKASVVEDVFVGDQPLHGVYGRLAG